MTNHSKNRLCSHITLCQYTNSAKHRKKLKRNKTDWFGWLLCIPLILSSIDTIVAQTFLLPSNDDSVIGQVETVNARFEETLLDIARQHNLGFEAIQLANPDIDPWLPGEGTTIVLPKQFILPSGPKQGIVINIPEMRLYYYQQDQNLSSPMVTTYPISIGREGWTTPLGLTQVVKKQANMSWYPPVSIREEYAAAGKILPEKVPPGPDNPLGNYALRLTLPEYLIHGTNRPFSIGMRVTHGCIRLYPENIKALYEQVTLGTPVRIINQPYKAGWRAQQLYLEAHPPLAEDAQFEAINQTPAIRAIITASANAGVVDIHWQQVDKIIQQTRGLPMPIAAQH